MANLVRALFLILITLACGCSHGTLVALAPDLDGKVGSISVSNEAGSVNIDTAYQATSIADAKVRPETPVQLDQASVQRVFGEALSIQPKPPVHFLLYFDKETTLNEASVRLFPDIVAAIRERSSEDISVIGHTDTVGSSEFNAELSSRRALAVKALLVGRGIPSHMIRTTSHGKENPLVPTGDNVNEPRNRRVEVDVK